jgi:hypothetical protein
VQRTYSEKGGRIEPCKDGEDGQVLSFLDNETGMPEADAVIHWPFPWQFSTDCTLQTATQDQGPMESSAATREASLGEK